jgi:hypothetical protein
MRFAATGYVADARGLSHETAHRSPPLGVLALVFAALYIASVVVALTMAGADPYPGPETSFGGFVGYSTEYPNAMHVVSFLQFSASIPLGLFAATIASRLLFHRVNVAGVHIALFGGVSASIMLAVSALAIWTTSQQGVVNSGAMRAMEMLAFSAGGFGHVAMLGLLAAGVSMPSLAFRLMPAWLCWCGLAAAVICELSTFGLLLPGVSLLVPLGRYLAIAWLVGAGLMMPRARQA